MTNDIPDMHLADFGPTSTPTIRMDGTTNQLSIDWSGERPEEVIISADLLEGWVTERNGLVQAMRAQHAVLTKARLGRTINKEDWETVGLVEVGQPTINLKARASDE